MPWKFIRPDDADSMRQYEESLDRIGGWWDASRNKSRGSRRRSRGEADPGWDLSAWMRQRLAAVDPRLRWDAGPDPEGGTSSSSPPAPNDTSGRWSFA